MFGQLCTIGKLLGAGRNEKKKTLCRLGSIKETLGWIAGCIPAIHLAGISFNNMWNIYLSHSAGRMIRLSYKMQELLVRVSSPDSDSPWPPNMDLRFCTCETLLELVG